MLGEVWESVLGCGEGKGEKWKEVKGVWVEVLGCGGRCRKVLGEM